MIILDIGPAKANLLAMISAIWKIDNINKI